MDRRRQCIALDRCVDAFGMRQVVADPARILAVATAERVSMRQIREVLRLRFASELPQRAIAKSLGLSQGAVSGYLSRARAAGVSWPLPADLDDVQLEALLFPPPPAIAADQRPMPDWAWVHRELRRPNVTLALLWEEYRAGAPDGFGYSWFCDLVGQAG
jgi:predicted DNA-binding protein (UPF0251 family)